MQRLDRLERVTDLLLVLLDTSRPLSFREIADRVPGYPDTHDARRQAFERDKRLLRDEGVPVLVEPIGGEEQLGYRVDPDTYYLPDLGLEPDEQAALNLAVAGVHLGEPTGRDALREAGRAAANRRSRRRHAARRAAADRGPARRSRPCSRRRAATRCATFEYRGECRGGSTSQGSGSGGVAGTRWATTATAARPRTFRVDRIDGPIELGEPSSGLADDVEVDATLGARALAVRRRGGRGGRRAGRRPGGGPGGRGARRRRSVRAAAGRRRRAAARHRRGRTGLLGARPARPRGGPPSGRNAGGGRGAARGIDRVGRREVPTGEQADRHRRAARGGCSRSWPGSPRRARRRSTRRPTLRPRAGSAGGGARDGRVLRGAPVHARTS